MNSKDQKLFIKRYDKSFEKFGISSKALGWSGGKERQYKRFKAAIDFTLFENRPIKTILDIGCGLGHFGLWLREKKYSIDYKGIDINPNFIKIGKDHYDLNISNDDILSIPNNSYDLVVANGIFNFKLKYEDHEKYIKTMMEKFMDIARVGIAVDFMSMYVDYIQPNSFHCSESLIIDTLKTRTKKYILRNDYLDFEFIVYVYL